MGGSTRYAAVDPEHPSPAASAEIEVLGSLPQAVDQRTIAVDLDSAAGHLVIRPAALMSTYCSADVFGARVPETRVSELAEAGPRDYVAAA